MFFMRPDSVSSYPAVVVVVGSVAVGKEADSAYIAEQNLAGE
jgi:pantothenate kinase